MSGSTFLAGDKTFDLADSSCHRCHLSEQITGMPLTLFSHSEMAGTGRRWPWYRSMGALLLVLVVTQLALWSTIALTLGTPSADHASDDYIRSYLDAPSAGLSMECVAHSS